MARKNNEQSDLNEDEYFRLIKAQNAVDSFRRAEKPKTKEMRSKYLGDDK